MATDKRPGRRAPEEEVEEGASWMTTYSDMVTLLLTFFVLMFAISNIDAQKFALLAAGLSRDGITAESFLEIQKEFNMAGIGEPDPDNLEYPGPEDEEPKPGKDEPDESGGELGQLHALIMDYIIGNGLENSIAVTFNGDKLLLTLTNDIWFQSGSSEISVEMKDKALALAMLLRDTYNEDSPFDIITVGHTDDRPINTARYPSNWYLSVDRAVKFLELLLADSELNPNIFSARGCGEQFPIADNETEEGRALNRRVEVLISQPKEQRK